MPGGTGQTRDLLASGEIHHVLLGQPGLGPGIASTDQPGAYGIGTAPRPAASKKYPEQ
jgi:hypothetical protein